MWPPFCFFRGRRSDPDPSGKRSKNVTDTFGEVGLIKSTKPTKFSSDFGLLVGGSSTRVGKSIELVDLSVEVRKTR